MELITGLRRLSQSAKHGRDSSGESKSCFLAGFFHTKPKDHLYFINSMFYIILSTVYILPLMLSLSLMTGQGISTEWELMSSEPPSLLGILLESTTSQCCRSRPRCGEGHSTDFVSFLPHDSHAVIAMFAIGGFVRKPRL